MFPPISIFAFQIRIAFTGYSKSYIGVLNRFCVNIFYHFSFARFFGPWTLGSTAPRSPKGAGTISSRLRLDIFLNDPPHGVDERHLGEMRQIAIIPGYYVGFGVCPEFRQGVYFHVCVVCVPKKPQMGANLNAPGNMKNLPFTPDVYPHRTQRRLVAAVFGPSGRVRPIPYWNVLLFKFLVWPPRRLEVMWWSR